MKFNLFLLTIVLLGSIPCFYAANLANQNDICQSPAISHHKRQTKEAESLTDETKPDDAEQTCKQGNKYFKEKLFCRKDGINKIRSLANEVYTKYRDTIIGSDPGDFWQVGTIEGCNGMSADSCSCEKRRQIRKTVPPINLNQITTINTPHSNTMNTIFIEKKKRTKKKKPKNLKHITRKNYQKKHITTINTPHNNRMQGSFVILVENLQKDDNKKCKFAIAHEVNSAYYIMPMTCPKEASYIVTAMIDGKKKTYARRKLLQKGNCGT